MAVASFHSMCEQRRLDMQHLLTHSPGIDVVRSDEPHRVFQACDPRNHPDGIAIRLNDHGVRVGLEKRIDRRMGVATSLGSGS